MSRFDPSVSAPLMGTFAFAALSSLAACASAGHLAEYDFRDHSLAVVSTLPPRPQVVLEAEPVSDQEAEERRSWWRALFLMGTGAVRGVQAERAEEKIVRAAESVDISVLVGDEVLERSARLLGARPHPSAQGADFHVEVEVREYGIVAHSWSSRAEYFVNAELRLLDGPSGRRIWKGDVEATEPISTRSWGLGGGVGHLITASELADLSVPEIERALEDLAHFSAVQLARGLEEGLEKAGRR